MRKLSVCLIGTFLIVGISSARAQEVVWRSRIVMESGPNHNPGIFNLTNRSPSFPRGQENLQRDFFSVYRTDQIDTMLAARDQTMAAHKVETEEATRALRKQIGDEVVASLRALPEQLFGAEARAALATEVAGRLAVVMEERIAAARRDLRNEILAEVDQRLGAHK